MLLGLLNCLVASIAETRDVAAVATRWNYYDAPASSVSGKIFNIDPFFGALAGFKRYVRRLLLRKNRYTNVSLVDEPAVLAWETGNELVGVPPAWTRSVTAFIYDRSAVDHKNAIRCC